VRELREAEVQHLYTRLRHQNVARLQIAVHDTSLVRGLQSRRQLNGQRQGAFDGLRSAKRRALHILHHQIVGTDVVQRADVRMIQRRNRLGFPLEAVGELLVGCLDGHDAVEACVACFVDLAHAPRAYER
jgi:hypothetical protein